ncbi:MAG: FGGY-family carbohydrate kinase [Acidihalobacter sp.]
MPSDLQLGIDFGTSGVRLCVRDPDGGIHARAALPLPPPIGGEDVPERWRQALIVLLGRIPAELRDAIDTICVDGTSGTLLLCDPHGEPLTPALMYDDARAREEAARIARVAPLQSGAHGATASLAKLMWLQKHVASDRPVHALHQAEWITGLLLGRFGAGDENNALKLGYDPVRRTWPAWLDELDIPRGWLPDVHPAGTPLGTLSIYAARTLGLPFRVRIVAGTTDSLAAVLATPAAKPGDAVTSLGSTLALKVYAPHPVFAPEYGIYSHRLGDRWLAGGASNAGGAVLRQFFSPERLAELSEQIDPEVPTDLDYYPLPRPGERFPHADPERQPRLTPRPENDAVFLQGMLEGLARIEAEGYRRLQAAGAPPVQRVYSLGGGAVNEAYRHIRQRHLGVPVESLPEAQAACGAARLAADGIMPAGSNQGDNA